MQTSDDDSLQSGVQSTNLPVDGELVTLVTGASGFIGSSVVMKLLESGRKVRCLLHSRKLPKELESFIQSRRQANIERFQGDLRSARDCAAAVEGIHVVYNVAGGAQGDSFEAVRQSAIEPLKTLLEAVENSKTLRRFVHVSSFAVYSNLHMPAGSMLDENSPIEADPILRGEPYTYAKVVQENLVRDFGKRGIPWVILRPGAVYGPGNSVISGRIGIPTSKVFLHFGDSNIIPFTYVDNCAEAIVLAGVREGINGEVINVVDDGAITSRQFLHYQSQNGVGIRHLTLPKMLSYSLYCALGLLSKGRHDNPSKYNRRRWCAYWKGNTYTNEKLKRVLGWSQSVPMDEGMRRYVEYRRSLKASNA
jgi:nucleoside-diphosphate-sugar epimerase